MVSPQSEATATGKVQRIDVPLNRVEGDLELRVDVRDGVVVDAWSRGTMYRGIENVMCGRGPLDGLVVTPRICGICGTAHLSAAAQALDRIAGVRPPENALHVRNLALATEHLQSDVRQAILMFMVDFTQPAYHDHPARDEIAARYAPFCGESVVSTLQATRRVLELIAILGGQWPHSSYMVPGGVTSRPNDADLLACRQLVDEYRRWYERQVLGCALEYWAEVTTAEELERWYEASEQHRASDLGWFLRLAREAGLERVGVGTGCFLSYGAFEIAGEPATTGAPARHWPAGFARGTEIAALDPAAIREHTAASWYAGEGTGVHPARGETRPYASGGEGQRYSWAKAPRYEGEAAETGPLAELLIARDPLITDIVRRAGASAWVRQLARIVRPARLLPLMEDWLDALDLGASFYRAAPEIGEGEAAGLVEASRGALGHWVRIAGGKIRHYQVIAPTTWNGSPRDANGRRGPWEEALIGTPVLDAHNPVEVGHVVRSFDPCLVCTVHAVQGPRTLARKRLIASP